MAFVYPPIQNPAGERSEQLARLAYELLDAHADTEALIREAPNELKWRAHLSYLRDLQRIGRELLAQPFEPIPSGAGKDLLSDVVLLTSALSLSALRTQRKARGS